MFHLKRATSNHIDFKTLVSLLDADLAIRDGADATFYAQFNAIVDVLPTVIYYSNNIPVACAGIKKVDSTIVEVKRMYVLPAHREKGIASKILNELERWAIEIGYTHCILETGLRQPEAIALYKKNGYDITPNYFPYEGIVNSVCFKKILIHR